MSEINRGIPEGVTHKATVINFEAAKEIGLTEEDANKA
jgi:CRISPR/Cas system type I-B associated protein Csh2 (Cas7 group RAMP superfamily)